MPIASISVVAQRPRTLERKAPQPRTRKEQALLLAKFPGSDWSMVRPAPRSEARRAGGHGQDSEQASSAASTCLSKASPSLPDSAPRLASACRSVAPGAAAGLESRSSAISMLPTTCSSSSRAKSASPSIRWPARAVSFRESRSRRGVRRISCDRRRSPLGKRRGGGEAASSLRCPAAAFQELLQTEPKVAQALLPQLVTKIRALTTRVYEFSTLAVNNRIQAELLRLASLAPREGKSAHIVPAPTHVEIASRVSTHREAVTRELNRLSRIGIIERKRRRTSGQGRGSPGRDGSRGDRRIGGNWGAKQDYRVIR